MTVVTGVGVYTDPVPGAPGGTVLGMFDVQVWIDAVQVWLREVLTVRATTPGAVEPGLAQALAGHGDRVGTDVADLLLALDDRRVVLPEVTVQVVGHTLGQVIGVHPDLVAQVVCELSALPGAVHLRDLTWQALGDPAVALVRDVLAERCPQYLAPDRWLGLTGGVAEGVDAVEDGRQLAAFCAALPRVTRFGGQLMYYTRDRCLARAVPHAPADQSVTWRAVESVTSPGGVVHPFWTYNLPPALMVSQRAADTARRRVRVSPTASVGRRGLGRG